MNISPSSPQNTHLPAAQELLNRTITDIKPTDQMTPKDVLRPPSAKPRVRTTTSALLERDEDTMQTQEKKRPSTVHVTNIHEHLRRAHQVSNFVLEKVTTDLYKVKISIILRAIKMGSRKTN